jgi:methyl-accepting chemotaxis protein
MSSNQGLDERLRFLGLEGAAQTLLRGIKPTLMAAMSKALDRFYAKIMTMPDMRRYFPNDSLVASAKARQGKHWDLIASGQFDASYVAAVNKVGTTHARLGLAPRWYIGEAGSPLVGGGARRRSPTSGGAACRCDEGRIAGHGHGNRGLSGG